MRNLRRYLWPGNPRHALHLLRSQPGTGALLAGGTQLAEEASPELDYVVDISRLGLDRQAVAGGRLYLGATLPLHTLLSSPLVRPLAGGILAEAIGATRTEPWRRQATLAGRLLTADPFDRIRPVCLALDAQVQLLHADHVEPQVMCLSDALALDAKVAIWLEIQIPQVLPGWRFALESLAQTVHDAALVTVVVGTRCKNGRIAEARVAIAGVDPAPTRAQHCENKLVDLPWESHDLVAAQDTLLAEVHPISDHRASSDYRAHLARTLLARALRRTLDTARDGGSHAPAP